MSANALVRVIKEEIDKEFSKNTPFTIEVTDIDYENSVCVKVIARSDFNAPITVLRNFPYIVMRSTEGARTEIRPIIRYMHNEIVKLVEDESLWDVSLHRYILDDEWYHN